MDRKPTPLKKHFWRIETTLILLFVIAVFVLEVLLWIDDKLDEIEKLDVEVERVQDKLNRKEVIEPRKSGGGVSLPPVP